MVNFRVKQLLFIFGLVFSCAVVHAASPYWNVNSTSAQVRVPITMSSATTLSGTVNFSSGVAFNGSDGTSGSVLYVDSSKNLAQNNSNLFWDNSNTNLGIRNASPGYDLTVGNSSAGSDPTITLESTFGARDHWVRSRVFGTEQGYLRFKTYSGGSDSSGVILSPDGTVRYNFVVAGFGIGTNAPSATLHISSGTFLMDGTGSTATINGTAFLTAPNNSTAFTIKISTTQNSVTASDTFISFASDTGAEGSIAGTAVAGIIAYNTFTGSHWTQIKGKVKPAIFSPLCSTGETFSSKEQLIRSEVCTEKGSKRIIGFYGGTDNLGNDMSFSIGSGYAWVKNTGFPVEIGDWLMTSGDGITVEVQGSSIDGVFVRDSQVRNSTAAKAIQPIIWKTGEKSRKIAVTYHAG